MKKIMYMAVAAIAALSSCSSEELAGSNGNNGDAKVFTGTIESDGVTSRSTIVNKTANWESTDKVCINGAVYTVTPQSDATKATFTKESGTEPTGTYKAFYANGANSGNYWDSSTSSFKLPASYTYEAGKFNMPMYAQNATTSLGFQNICGVLAITVTSAQMSSVDSIKVTSDKEISGACTIKSEDVSGVTKYYVEAKGTADADKIVTLKCSSAVNPTSDGTVFYLPVPAGDHILKVEAITGTTGYYMTTSSAVTIERNKIYNITYQKIENNKQEYPSCLAAGTRITMADGTTKLIKNVAEGDMIQTFDHEAGTLSSAKVCLAWKGESKVQPMNITFASGKTLGIVGTHDLLFENTRKYVRINKGNVASYIGKRFYNAETGSWDTLTGYAMGEPVDYYCLYTAKHLDCVAEGLLTCPDDVDLLLNIYELDSNLKANPEQLSADITKYGLLDIARDFPDYAQYKELMEDLGCKYVYIAIGKGLAPDNYVETMKSYWTEK